MRNATRTDRNLLTFSLAAAAYFGFPDLNHFVLRLDSVALGVVVELLTISMILAVAAAFLFAAARILRDRRRANPANVAVAAILLAIGCLVWI